jgi:hypothetical protein
MYIYIYIYIKVKRATHTQEGARILRNTKRDLPWALMAGHLNTLMKRLQESGNFEKYRLEILQGALRTFEKQEKIEDSGTRPINRPDSWEREARALSKL